MQAPLTAFRPPPPDHPNHPGLEFEIGALPRRPQLRWGLAGRYLAAGCAFSLVLVAIMFWINEIGFLPVRFGVVAAFFGFTALVMALYVAGLRIVVFLAAALLWVGPFTSSRRKAAV